MTSDEYAEVVEHDPENKVLTLLKPNGDEKRGLVEEFAGWQFLPAWKVIRADGEVVYCADVPKHQRNTTGIAWFSRGGIFV